MDQQSGKYFTIFYGIYNTQTREIVYSSGGHPPPIIVTPDGTARPLPGNGMIIGALPFAKYMDNTATLDAGTKLFVFSDGCYEVWAAGGETMMTHEDFAAILAISAPHSDSLDRAVAATQNYQQRPEFEDDFSLIQFHL
jgi:sigma-B regulation protein RsbU (phosphoserine phosphatase)